METKHTKTPWTCNQLSDRERGQFEITKDQRCYWIARVGAPIEDYAIAKANAEFIVKACNMHDELVAALEAIKSRLLNDRRTFERYGFQSCDDKEDDIMDVVVCTLSKVKG